MYNAHSFFYKEKAGRKDSQRVFGRMLTYQKGINLFTMILIYAIHILTKEHAFLYKQQELEYSLILAMVGLKWPFDHWRMKIIY